MAKPVTDGCAAKWQMKNCLDLKPEVCVHLQYRLILLIYS